MLAGIITHPFFVPLRFSKNVGGLKNVWGICQQILCMGLRKCWGGRGMQKYFRDLKKMLGGGGDFALIFYRLEKYRGGGMPTNCMDLKMLGGSKMFEGMPANFVYGFEKMLGGGYAKIV